jgi:hypothetical protein
MNKLKAILFLLIFLLLYGIAGTMDYNNLMGV